MSFHFRSLTFVRCYRIQTESKYAQVALKSSREVLTHGSLGSIWVAGMAGTQDPEMFG